MADGFNGLLEDHVRMHKECINIHEYAIPFPPIKKLLEVIFMEFCEAYQMFLEYVEARGHSPLTVSSYRQD